MIVTQVTPLLVSHPSDSWSWVKVETDCGFVGWGEYSGNPISNAAVTAVIRVLGQRMVGRDPLNIGECLSDVRDWRYPSFLDFRCMMIAASALDMALWDIRGRVAGVPLRTLFHAPDISSVALYANLNRLLRKDRSLDRLTTTAESAVSSGIGMVKLAPFDEVTPLIEAPDVISGVHRCREVGKRIGLERISLDCHCRFTPASFETMLDTFGEEIDQIQFIEDPVRIHLDRDIAPIKKRWPQFQYASGEDCFAKAELKELAEGGHLSILNPDVKYVGGITGAAELIPILRSAGVNVALHNPSGPIATAHSAQLSALCGPDTALEFAYGDSEARSRSLTDGEPVEHGRYLLTDRPGIGVDPSQEFLEQYASTGI